MKSLTLLVFIVFLSFSLYAQEESPVEEKDTKESEKVEEVKKSDDQSADVQPEVHDRLDGRLLPDFGSGGNSSRPSIASGQGVDLDTGQWPVVAAVVDPDRTPLATFGRLGHWRACRRHRRTTSRGNILMSTAHSSET